MSNATLFLDTSLKSKIVDFTAQQKNLTPVRSFAPTPAKTPYPTLIDKTLTIWDADIIVEYLDERFPVPCLMPSLPSERAHMKQLLRVLYTDLIHPIHYDPSSASSETISKILIWLSDGLKNTNYLFSKELTVLDCMILPTLDFIHSHELQFPTAFNNYFKNNFFIPEPAELAPEEDLA